MKICVDEELKLDYLNGLLSENERIRFEEHLSACPDCRRELEELQTILASLADLPHPSAPDVWVDAAKALLKGERSAFGSQATASPAPIHGGTKIFQYVLIAAIVTAATGILFWMAMSGTIQRWLPGFSTAALEISDPQTARTVNIVAMIVSLHALLFIPSIIDNLYQLIRRRGRKVPHETSIGFFAC